jgi:holliday junction DNA helicase RuvA
MIDLLSGHVLGMNKDSLLIGVGGVGFRVYASRAALESATIGQPVTLHTNLQVREDSLTLYGFATEEERSMFELLLSVSGVGPKSAIGVLSTLSVENIRAAVIRNEPLVLTRAQGIGKKTAEKIVFELKNKMTADGMSAIVAVSDVDTEVIANLTALGYSLIEAQQALQAIPRDASPDIETRVMLALQYFA